MTKQYEPFLINPPRRLPRRFGKRINRARINPFKYRRNDYDPGMDAADPSEMGIGVLPGHSTMHKRPAVIRKSKKTAAAAKRKRMYSKLKKQKPARLTMTEFLARLSKKKAGKKVVTKGGVMAKKKATKRKAVKKASSKKRKGGVKKGSAAAKKWGRLMARLRKAKSKTGTKRKRKAVKVVATRKRKSVKRSHAHTKHVKASVKVGKRKYSKKSIKGRKRKHVAVAHYGKAWRTVPGIHKPFRAGVKVNPFRRNPFGSELMVVGANPRRKKSRKSGGSMAKRKRFHSKPMSSLKALAPMVIAGTVGAVATKMAPKLLGMTNVWAGYGTQLAVIAGGGYAADKWLGKNVSDGWIIGGAAAVLSGIVSTTLGGVFAGLGLDYEDYAAFPTNDNQMAAFPDGGMGMLDNESLGGDYDLDQYM